MLIALPFMMTQTCAVLVQGITVTVIAAIFSRLEYVPWVLIAPETDFITRVQLAKQRHRLVQPR